MYSFFDSYNMYTQDAISIQALNKNILLCIQLLFACEYSLRFVKVHNIENYIVTCSLLKVWSCMDVNVSNSFIIE